MTWDENEHPRGKNGRFTDKNKKEELYRKLQTVPKATEFNRPKTKHHMRHAKEMGLNEKQYIKAAVDFFNNGVGKMYYCEKTEKMYKYSNSERLMCVCSLMGGIHTFMKITNKEFYDTIIREKLIEV